jgi:glycosyltransferase involved in cell wall biosynthesis
LAAIEEVLTDGETALLAEPGNSECVAEKIRMVLQDPGLGERLSQAAFARVQPHTWEERAKRIASFASTLTPAR